MKVTYKGQTKEQLKGQIKYCNEALAQDLEKWELKEYVEVKQDCENGLTSIDEREQLLKQS